MVRALFLATLSAFIFASPAGAQVFTIWAEAPETVLPGETYAVEFWGSIEGEPFVEGESAVAGFGISARATSGAELVAVNHGSEIAEWAAGFGTDGTVVDADLLDVSGGQLASIFGDDWTDMTHPIVLFTFEVTVGESRGAITYTPSDPNPNGGLSFYPDWNDGHSITAPNDPGTTLVLVGATTVIVPSPMLLVALTMMAAPFQARRRSRRRTEENMSC